ncbi:C40 family peptidase [Actinomyces timonensis]|uniref:C40 family peptidase n=1 Tax=Actinomyces timonensis TaxID=1288391 RepID=UPI0002E05ABF|nr:C40 family peptidase [Actinomyces timonensis]
MTTHSQARHRAAKRPTTPLTEVAPATRRGIALAASSGLALTMVASGAATASVAEPAEASAGSLEASGLNQLALDAHTAVTTNAAIVVGTDVQADTFNHESEAAEATAAEAPKPVVETPAPQAEQAQEARAEQGDASTQQAAAQAAPAAQAQPAAAPASASGSSIVSIAMQYVGTPYVYGGSSPSGFDCSGFVQYVYAQAGISLPRTSGAQAAAGTAVSMSEAQPGDIVYYGYHVGIYAGNGMMIDAGNESTGVVYREIWGTPISFIRIG